MSRFTRRSRFSRHAMDRCCLPRFIDASLLLVPPRNREENKEKKARFLSTFYVGNNELLVEPTPSARFRGRLRDAYLLCPFYDVVGLRETTITIPSRCSLSSFLPRGAMNSPQTPRFHERHEPTYSAYSVLLRSRCFPLLCFSLSLSLLFSSLFS